MEIKNLSFGSITIDGITYDNDVVIKNGMSKSERKVNRKNTGTSSDIHRFPRTKIYHGNASDLSSARVIVQVSL